MGSIICDYLLPARPVPDEEPPEELGLDVLEPPVLPLGRGAGLDTLLLRGFGELFTVGVLLPGDLLGVTFGEALLSPVDFFTAG